MELDRTDQRILRVLQVNGRISNRDLAERVALSPSACLKRVRRLEQAGVIRGYRADLDLSRVRDSVTVSAEVTLGRHQVADFARFESELAAIPEVVEACQISGRFDFLVTFVCRDIDHYRELTDGLLDGDSGVSTITSNIRMKVSKGFAGYPLD
ncbi:MAG: Lrp/AsnC family transcriptional regulator [Gammaproteobacteria bacterium]|nr:Lrp/AsnC family transcriptional regulator [Gammaproteobacteria bacterium]